MYLKHIEQFSKLSGRLENQSQKLEKNQDGQHSQDDAKLMCQKWPEKGHYHHHYTLAAGAGTWFCCF